MSKRLKRKRPNTTPCPRKKLTPSVKDGQRSIPVRSDELKWKEVTISKYLDDAEGFYGLDELSDVEVVRDGKVKGVLFRTLAEDDYAQGNGDDSGREEEWSGFGDEANIDAVDSNAENGSKKSQKSSNERIGNVAEAARQKSQAKQTNDELDAGNGFALLNNEVNEPEIDMSAWKDLQLSSQILYALSALKFAEPTPIQRAAIPLIISGNDLIGKAVTGSGKTLAFGIPIIEAWLEAPAPDRANPIALIVAPTRELAHQITKHLSAICQGLDAYPNIVTVTGGLSVLKQQRQLEKSDIVVGTPGRLWEVLSESNDLLARLRGIKFLVTDEADRLLSDGHFKELEDILDALDRETVDEAGAERAEDDDSARTAQKSSRQILVFSATFHKGLQQKLMSKQRRRTDRDSNLLNDQKSLEYLIHKLPFQEGQKPSFIDANPESQLAESLSETILECKAMEKDLYLYTFLLQDQHRRRKSMSNGPPTAPAQSVARILVFTNSVSAVKRLVPLLQSLNLPSTSISPLHSNMPQKSRLRSLERFSGLNDDAKTPSTAVLVATDVAARGLDIKGITTIVHYHVPRTADTYVHRSGRTARSNKTGESILLCSPDETASVTELIAKIHAQAKSNKDTNNLIDRMYLPTDLVRQVQQRVELAQKVVNSSQSTEKVHSEDNWLRKAADELGVDYDSEEFEQAGKQGRRGRGGGKDRKQKKAAQEQKQQTKVVEWKRQLKEDLQKRIDFGDGVGKNLKYLAGGAFDVDKLLAERGQI